MFQQEVQWIPDQQTGVPTPWIRDKSAQWRIPQGWKAPDSEQPGPTVSEMNVWYNNRAKAKQHYRDQVTVGENGMVPVFSEQQIDQFIDRDYPPLSGMQGLNSAGFDARYGDSYNAQQQAPQQQVAPPAPWSIQGLQQLRELITSGQVDTSSVPGGPNVHKTATALHSIDGIIKFQTKYPSYDVVPRDEKLRWIEWRMNLQGLIQ